MARDLNRWEGIGRLGNDPETRYLPDGTATVSLSIACGDDYKDSSGNKEERTEWVRLAAFGKLAEIIGQYAVKGKQVFASGKLTTRKWTDKDGQDRYTTEIRLNDFQLLGSASDSGGQGGRSNHGDDGYSPPPQRNPQGAPQSGGRPKPSFDDLGDDIPF